MFYESESENNYIQNAPNIIIRNANNVIHLSVLCLRGELVVVILSTCTRFTNSLISFADVCKFSVQ